MEYPINYDSPKDLIKFLDSAGLSMKKRFGQNFLINKGAREKIISYLPIKENDSIWEIGPGLGAMTWHILEKKASLSVFEIDYGFIKALKDFYGNFKNFDIIEGDFLKIFKKIQLEELSEVKNPKFILGNLPYVSGSVMIAEIIKSNINPEKMVFTLQKEVGSRMAAVPGTKDYSSFSLLCQSKYNVNLKGQLNPGSFFPSPSVKSVIVELTAHHCFNEKLTTVYYDLINDLFRSRRKTILNNISDGIISKKIGKENMVFALKESKIDFSDRSETLGYKDVEKICKNILQFY